MLHVREGAWQSPCDSVYLASGIRLFSCMYALCRMILAKHLEAGPSIAGSWKQMGHLPGALAAGIQRRVCIWAVYMLMSGAIIMDVSVLSTLTLRLMLETVFTEWHQAETALGMDSSLRLSATCVSEGWCSH